MTLTSVASRVNAKGIILLHCIYLLLWYIRIKLCFACDYSVLFSLLFWSEINCFFKCNCTYVELLIFWTASLCSSRRLLLSQLFKGKSELFQQLLILLNTQLRDRTHKVPHGNLRQQESTTFLQS